MSMEFVGNDLLMQLIVGLISSDPQQRFPSAEAADLSETGAAAFHRQFVPGNLSSEYENDLRLWLMSLGEILPNLKVYSELRTPLTNR